MGLIAPWHVGSSWTRDQSHVSCISRSLNRWKSQTGIFWITLLWIIVYLSFGEFSSLWYKTMKGYTGPWGRYKFRLNAAKSLQSCPTLCDPIDGSPPGSLIPGILQTRTLEWAAISFFNAWKWKVKLKHEHLSNDYLCDFLRRNLCMAISINTIDRHNFLCILC